MAALPADIAKYTTDGVLLVSPADPATAAAIKAEHVDARDGTGSEIEQFFDSEADGQAMLDELFAIQSTVNPLYMALETEESLGLGTTIAISPRVPCVTITDDLAGLSKVARVRSFAADLGTDRYAVEVIE